MEPFLSLTARRKHRAGACAPRPLPATRQGDRRSRSDHRDPSRGCIADPITGGPAGGRTHGMRAGHLGRRREADGRGTGACSQSCSSRSPASRHRSGRDCPTAGVGSIHAGCPGAPYASVEHFQGQALCSDRPEMAERFRSDAEVDAVGPIRSCGRPVEVPIGALGRPSTCRAGRPAACRQAGPRARWAQDGLFREILVSTTGWALHFGAPCGTQGRPQGENWLGKLLMDLRPDDRGRPSGGGRPAESAHKAP